MSLFHFSPLNYDLVQSTPSGSLNILWNQLNQKSIANSMMYMTPTFNFSIGYEYPEFWMFGNNLFNPLLAMQQTLQAFQNGSWMNGNNWGGWQMPWNTPWGTTPSGSSTSNSEYDALKALITKYKEIGTKNSSLSPSLLDKINNALNKSGKPEEKLEALRDLYKQLDKNKLEKALLELPEYKKMLDVAGYKFKGTNKEEDNKLKESLRKLKRDLVDKKKGDELSKIASGVTSSSILRLISYWNDDHSGKNERGIIRMVANNLPAEESEMELHKDGIEKLTKALLNKADELIVEYDNAFSNLEKATDAVSDAMATVEKEFTQENLLALAKEFDTLYAMLRMMEAERVRNTINTKYGFLNDISSTDKDIADDNLIVEDTKADLKKEGIEVKDLKLDDIPEEDDAEVSDVDDSDMTAEEKLDALKGKIAETDREGVYTTVQTSEHEPAKFYTFKEDKLVELKGVKSIDKDGNCTMADGSKKVQKDVETVEVSVQDVIDYNNTLKRVENLYGVKIYKCSTKLNGSTLYKSKGIQENGYSQYFIIKDNKLMRVVCDYVDKNGNVVINGVTKAAKDLTDDNFETISDSDIVTTNKKIEAEERKAQEENEELEAICKKEFKKVESEDGETIGNDIVDDLEWCTTDDEWVNACDNIKKIKKENIYSVIKGYEDDLNWGADHIIRQIRTENGREDTKKMELITHIINVVWEYCKENGTNSEEAFREFYKLKAEISKNPQQLITKETAEKLDRCILRIFGLN